MQASHLRFAWRLAGSLYRPSTACARLCAAASFHQGCRHFPRIAASAPSLRHGNLMAALQTFDRERLGDG